MTRRIPHWPGWAGPLVLAAAFAGPAAAQDGPAEVGRPPEAAAPANVEAPAETEPSAEAARGTEPEPSAEAGLPPCPHPLVPDAKPALAFDVDGVWITPIAAPAYSPELEFLIAGGAMVSWKADRCSPRSSFITTVGWGSVGAIVFANRATTFWFGDLIRFDLDLQFRDQVDNYFGVGYATNSSRAIGEDTTEYQRLSLLTRPVLLVRLGLRGLYGGVVFEANRIDATELAPVMAADPAVIDAGTELRNRGLGVVLRYDTRDVPQNAFTGVYLQAGATFYGDPLGSTSTYQILAVDYRQYVTLFRPGTTLAWNVRTRHGLGDVPWSELSLVGSPFDLRGYRLGQYRDRTSLFGVVEYRHFLMNRLTGDGTEVGDHALVVWVGAGSVGDGYDGLRDWLPNGGVGYRWAVQDRLSLRLDLGAGTEGVAFYFNFAEAF